MLRQATTLTVLAVASLFLAGCNALRIEPTEAYDAARPQAAPVRNITSFSESLRCMDDLFASYGMGDYGAGAAYITSQGVLDKTGKNLGDDNREVLIATLSKMSARSGAFVFVNYNPRDLAEIGLHLGTLVEKPQEFTWPSYELHGAVTQLDENVKTKSGSLSLAVGDADFGVAFDQIVSVLAVDFNVSKVVNRQVLNGVTSSNVIAITRRGVAGDGGGRIKKAGLFFNIALDKSEGLFAALRALIELSAIEVLGKLTRVPYWQCLQIEQTNPEVVAVTNDWFTGMKEPERVTFVQQALATQGYYNGAATGTLDNATRDAIGRYQAAANLVPSGRIDLALYRQLIGRDLRERVVQAQAPPPSDGTPPPRVATMVAARPFVTLTTPRGTAPVYAVNERLSLSVQVSQDAYLSCYYHDGHQRVSRLYPNRFQRQAFVRAEQIVTIPAGDNFALLIDAPNTMETVLCVATPEDIEARLPARLQPDLQALPGTSLDEIAEAFRQLAPHTLAEARLTARIGR